MSPARILAPLAIIMTITFAVPTAARAESLAYVNLARALLEVNEGQRAMKRIKATFEKKQKDLLVREKELKAMKDALDANSAVKDDSATRAKRAEFETKVMELQQTLYKEQQELEALKAKELSGIRDKMTKVIQKLGKAGKYSMILEIQDSRLLYAKPHLDLTNEVIRNYNLAHR